MIACLDVRANDKGDLVVTKGDQYDVRETTGENEVYFCYLYFYFSLLLVCEGRYMYKKKKNCGYNTSVYKCNESHVLLEFWIHVNLNAKIIC